MENLLLRFRDTSDHDTIAEHQLIIEKTGYVWWGWWKKDSEPDRDDLLVAVSQDIRGYNFFLFDRSTDRFFSIKVVEVSFVRKLKVYCPEPLNTPKYYSQEALRLWLKIVSIEMISIENFLKLFPIIPNNDYTFFTYSNVQQETLEVKTVNKRVELESNYVLHISDVHFGADYGFPMVQMPQKRPLLQIIDDFVKNELKKKIGLLIVSGDITSRGNGDFLLGDGLNFLNQLCEKLQIKKEAVIIIPGNHDIPLQDADFVSYSHETTFRLFLKEFYGAATEPFGLNFYKFPCGKNVDVLRMHSVKLRKKEESNYGYVDWFHYKNLLSNYELDGDVKIAVVHHHLVSMSIEEVLDPEYKYGSISVTLDSGRVIEGLQAKGFNFVLNGHQHIPGITRISRGIKNDLNEIHINNKTALTILSAGSAGVKNERFSQEMKYNSFSIYIVDDNSLDVEVKYYNPTIEPKRYYSSKLYFD